MPKVFGPTIDAMLKGAHIGWTSLVPRVSRLWQWGNLFLPNDCKLAGSYGSACLGIEGNNVFYDTSKRRTDLLSDHQRGKRSTRESFI